MNSYNDFLNAYRQNMWAAEGQKKDLMEAYRALPDKNITGDGEKNLYHVAATFFDYEAIEYLAAEGVKPRSDEYGNTPLHMMAKSPYGNDNTNYSKMEEAIFRTAKALVDAGVNPKKKNEDGKLAYVEAALSGIYPFIQVMAEAGVKMDAVGAEGKNLLHQITDKLYHRKTISGVTENAYKTIKALLDSGSPDPEDKDIFKHDALYYAQNSGVKEIAALISGDESAMRTGGMTPMQAILKNDMEALKALLEQGADPNAVEERNSLLMWACEYPRPEMVKFLLEKGADVNFRSGETGATAVFCLLTKALQNLGRGYGRQDPKDIKTILRTLISAGLDVNAAIDANGNTALIYVAAAGYMAGMNAALAEELLESGADVNGTNLSGQTALMIFASAGNEDEYGIAELLLDNGADTSLLDAGSNTALMYAAYNSNKASGKKIAELIIDSGYGDIGRTNNQGQSALDMAVAKENEALVKLLIMNQ